MAFLAGKAGQFKYASASYRVTKWTGNLRQQLLDVTSTDGNGAEEYTFGLYGGDVSFEFVVDNTLTYVASLGPGTTGTVELLPLASDTASKISGTLAVESLEVGLDVRGLVTGRGSGKFSGGYTVASL